jgi:hypothetical protein
VTGPEKEERLGARPGRVSWGATELAALGQAVVNFAYLEASVEALLQAFIEPWDVGTLLVTGEFMSWKLDKLSAIAQEQLVGSDRKALLDWCKDVRALNHRRNQLLHSTYLLQGAHAALRLEAGTRGGTWTAHSEPIHLDDLQEAAESFNGSAHSGFETAKHVRALRESRRAPDHLHGGFGG